MLNENFVSDLNIFENENFKGGQKPNSVFSVDNRGFGVVVEKNHL